VTLCPNTTDVAVAVRVVVVAAWETLRVAVPEDAAKVGSPE
jgi:hypothetical protein